MLFYISFDQDIHNWNITKSVHNSGYFSYDSPIEGSFSRNPYLYINSNYNGNI